MPPRNSTGSNGTGERYHHLWKSDQEWILLFDNLMKYSKRKSSSGTSGSTSESHVSTRLGGHQYHPSAQTAQLASQAANNSDLVCNSVAASTSSQRINTNSSHLPRFQGPLIRPKEMPLASSGSTTAANNVGGVEADNFMESFLDVPRINNVVSGPACEQEMSRINHTLSDVSADWTKRVDALKRLRSVVLAGGDIYKEFYSSLRFVDVSLICSVKDLRSQVVRETCVTLAFLSQQLGHKFERTAEVILPSLISLIPNSAKIISTSGIVTIRFIIQNTHSPKFVPIIVNHLQTSRSKDVRRYCCEFVKHILYIWSRESLEKHAALLQDAIKRGITDADPEARSLSRQAYWHFTNVFPNHADVLISQLDSSNKKMLEDGRQVPLQQQQRLTPPRDLSRPASRTRKSSGNETDGASCESVVPKRSSSAIDPDAARRARAKSGSGTSIPAASKQQSTSSGLATPMRSRRQFAAPSTPTASRSHSSANAPRKAFSSRSAATSRDNSPEKSVSITRKPSTGKPATPGSGRKTSTRGYESDDGESSQFGSQASLSGQRYAYSSTEILTLLASPNWSSRKEGLLGLQNYLRTGTLYPADVDNVRLLLTRMMSDPTTKVFGLFLDTLREFISKHKLDLGSWLYTLLTRLFGKMSVDLLPSVQGKIDRCLELIRGSFAAENQFQQLLKFVNDTLQTPNLKVKAAFLTYLVNLIKNNMAASDFKNTSAVRIGVTKIVNWSLDAKTPELRKMSQSVIIALHELNAGEFTSMLALMDEFLRDTALKILSGPSRKDSTEPLGIGKSRQNSVSSRNGSRSDLAAVEKDLVVTSPQSSNDENVNPEDFYACLRQTTQAIEKFNIYSNLDYSSGDEGRRNPGSEDSGFSRTSLNASAPLDSEHSSQNGDGSVGEKVGKLEQQIVEEHDSKKLLPDLSEMSSHLDETHISKSDQGPTEDSNAMLLNIAEALVHSDPEVILTALKVALKCAHTRVPLTESLIPPILDLQGDENTAVADAVDKTLLKLTEVLPVSSTVHVLSIQITDGESPGNCRAASFLHQLVQKMDAKSISANLSGLMPAVVQGFNLSNEPNVRKDCMLTVVNVQQKLGPEVVFPFIRDLTINKIKLLNLYLQKK